MTVISKATFFSISCRINVCTVATPAEPEHLLHKLFSAPFVLCLCSTAELMTYDGAGNLIGASRIF